MNPGLDRVSFTFFRPGTGGRCKPSSLMKDWCCQNAWIFAMLSLNSGSGCCVTHEYWDDQNAWSIIHLPRRWDLSFWRFVVVQYQGNIPCRRSTSHIVQVLLQTCSPILDYVKRKGVSCCVVIIQEWIHYSRSIRWRFTWTRLVMK